MLITVASAKGSPGVTTAARVLASVWPTDVVLADCDPAGGDLALLGRAPGGEVLDPDRGLLSLAAEARRGLAAGVLDEHLQRLDGGLDVLCGVTSPEQVTGIGPIWPALGGLFARLPGRDVLVDAGRLTVASPVVPVVAASDVLLLVVRPRLEGYAHLRERLRWLESVGHGSGPGPAIGVVVVTEPKDDRSPGELARLLAHSGLRAPVIGRLAHDERAADVVAGRVQRSIARSLLVRSARDLVGPLHELAGSRSLVGADV